nr:unnamed protein product [Callosobruchus analis]
MFFVYLLKFIWLSICVSYTWEDIAKPMSIILGLKMGIDIFMYVDIFKIFCTGYYDSTNNITVLKPRLIALRYLKFFFWVDVLSSLTPIAYPLEMMLEHSMTLDMICDIACFLGLLMILRLPRWSYAMEMFRQYLNFSSYMFKATKSFLAYIVVMCWLFTAVMYLNNLIYFHYYNEVFSTYKLRRYFSITLTLLHVSNGADPARKVIDTIITTCFLCVGFGMQMYLYAQILQVWNKFSSARNKNEDLFRQFKEYMNYKGLPIQLRQRVFMYFNFKFQNEYFNEAQIYRMISENLRQEILLHVIKEHIQRVELFSTLPEDVLLKVVSKLRSEIFLPDDTVVEAGTTGNCMFFIYFGTVAIYTPTGREICHLQDGAHFGEIALVFNETRVATVVAVTACELFKLKRTDFFEVIETYPEQKQMIIQMALERLMGTSEVR